MVFPPNCNNNKMEGDDDANLLLWQRACFMEKQTPRSKADSLRLRVSHLQSTYHRSSSEEAPQLLQLLRFHLDQYSSVIDSQDKTTGLNNFEDSIQTLTAGALNESKGWKSGLAREKLLKMSQQSQMKDEIFEDKPFPISNTHIAPISTEPLPNESPTLLQKPLPKSLLQKPLSESPPPTELNSKTNVHYKFQYKKTDDNSYIEDIPNPYNKRSRWSYSKRKRQQDKEGSDEEEEENKPSSKKLNFMTAKDQYIINQKKKFGGHGGNGTMSGDKKYSNIEIDNYGNSKKSLGTRRAPGTKFVPPVKRNEESISNGLQSYDTSRGNDTSSLPPHLEGNEKLKNIEPRMVELIMNEIMDHSAPVDWDDIAGLKFAKETIKEIVVWPMLRPDIFKGLRGPPKGILLFGPPGTGKTLIGKCVASQVKATFFSISASSLTSKWVGEGEKMVRALFAVARCFEPAVIFIDEIDSLLSQRSDSEHESSRRIKTEFLVQLDGATTNPDDRLLVIGATNRPQEIDEAARRRLVKRLYIPLPDSVARKQIVMNLLKDNSFTLTEEDLDNLCNTSQGYSGADMANLCREAALGPIRDAAHNIQHISAEEVRPVTYADFQQAFYNIRPSVSEKDLELYLDWNEKYGCGNKR